MQPPQHSHATAGPTPFIPRCDGKPLNPVEHFGQQLEAAGFSKYGQETMISGVTGREMPCDIYVGVVYYQRLRHMVSDKFQVGRADGYANVCPHWLADTLRAEGEQSAPPLRSAACNQPCLLQCTVSSIRPRPPRARRPQVRSTGAINQLTRQPIKGRKLGGGIRFGEMERDSLLAHGAAYLLHDRLHACSDYHTLDVCTKWAPI